MIDPFPSTPKTPVNLKKCRPREYGASLIYGLAFLTILGVVCAIWLKQQVSPQELLANYAKANDFVVAAKSVGGLPWWTPMFLGGTSLAFSWTFMIANVVLLACSMPLGFLIGPKVATMICLGVGALGMAAFLRRYTRDAWCAIIGGTLFVLSSSLLTRAVQFEHFVVVCSLALLPWAFFGVLNFVRAPSSITALAAATAFAAVVLTYGKTGIMALPALGAFGLCEYFAQPRKARPALPLFVVAGLALFFLAVIPSLPALRESQFVSLFDFGPFQGWQNAFSTKSALSWIDRDGFVTRGIDPGFAPTSANGGTYLGIVAFCFLAVAVFAGTFHQSPLGKKARLFLVLSLMMFWLSFGPRSVLAGHFTFLGMSLGAPDVSPALGWLFLVAQVWLIFRLVPAEWPLRLLIATALALIYLLVPGFRLIEWMPIFQNIRAPFDFFQVTGVVCVIAATAIVVRVLVASIHPPVLRSGFAAAVLALAVLDVAPYARPFFSGTMERRVFDDFKAAQDYLKGSALQGRVYPFSGRYFYLLTPMLSGRPIVAEAFNSYLQQRGSALLQSAAFASDEQLSAYLNIAGISHVLIDKTDPDTPQEIRARLQGLTTVGFENDNFVILENSSSLASGFLAKDYIQAFDAEPSVAGPALAGASYQFATIQLPGVATGEPAYRGRIEGGRIVAKEGTPLTTGAPFAKLGTLAGGNYQRVAFTQNPSEGWLIFNEAWHPDWRASAGGEALPIRRAFLAFSAVRNPAGKSVVFEFSPPWWYPACAVIGALSWAVAALLLVVSAISGKMGRGPSPAGSTDD